MRIALAVGVLAALGCSTTKFGRTEVVNWQDNLTKVAAFQLNCPEHTLVVEDLGEGEKAGVTGCGQRETYVYDGRRGWDRAGEQGARVEVKGPRVFVAPGGR